MLRSIKFNTIYCLKNKDRNMNKDMLNLLLRINNSKKIVILYLIISLIWKCVNNSINSINL